MTTDVIVPSDLWEEEVEAVITSWLISDGSEVAEGKVIAELMVEKIQYELLAPASGIINIIKDVDEVVSKSERIATVA